MFAHIFLVFSVVSRGVVEGLENFRVGDDDDGGGLVVGEVSPAV